MDTACFHCQQAIEKYLKAYLIFQKHSISKTHSIDFLLKQCGDIDEDFNDLDSGNLDDYAVRVRYPGDYLLPEIDEAKGFLDLVYKIRVLVLSKISEFN